MIYVLFLLTLFGFSRVSVCSNLKDILKDIILSFKSHQMWCYSIYQAVKTVSSVKAHTKKFLAQFIRVVTSVRIISNFKKRFQLIDLMTRALRSAMGNLSQARKISHRGSRFKAILVNITKKFESLP